MATPCSINAPVLEICVLMQAENSEVFHFAPSVGLFFCDGQSCLLKEEDEEERERKKKEGERERSETALAARHADCADICAGKEKVK